MEASSAFSILVLRGPNYLGKSFGPGTVSLNPDAVLRKPLEQDGWALAPNRDAEQDKMSQLGTERSTPRTSEGDADPWLLKLGLFLIQIPRSIKPCCL